MTKTRISDQDYLRNDQYKHAGNLNARIALHERFSVNQQGWAPWSWAQWLSLIPSSARVLEVGCGPAFIWTRSLGQIPADWRVTLSDFSPGMITAARAALGEAASRFTFVEADAQALPFPAASCEAVIAHHMLYHVPDRPKAYAEFRRVLVPGGVVIAALNGERHLREIGALVGEFDPNGIRTDCSANTRLPIEKAVGEMRGVFDQVEVRPFEDALLVTEVEPLVNYVMSDFHYQIREVVAFTRFVETRLNRDGVIRIGKESGLIVART